MTSPKLPQRYYHLDSGGAFTNLQLYCLRQAHRAWDELEADYQLDEEHTNQLRERCVFAVATLGLSISQLLGQNNPKPEAGVPAPAKLLRSFVNAHGLDPKLATEFARFQYFYDGCRHFGKSTSGIGHRRVDDLTFGAARECFDVGNRIWRAVLEVFGKVPGSDFADLDLDEESPEGEIFEDTEINLWQGLPDYIPDSPAHNATREEAAAYVTRLRVVLSNEQNPGTREQIRNLIEWATTAWLGPEEESGGD